MRFRTEQRIRRQGDFSHLRTRGHRHDCGAFLMVVVRPEPASPRVRLGVVASKAAIGNAPLRNRAKRRLREVFRAHQSLIPPGHDVLLIARRRLNRLPYEAIEQKFIAACHHLFPNARIDA